MRLAQRVSQWTVSTLLICLTSCAPESGQKVPRSYSNSHSNDLCQNGEKAKIEDALAIAGTRVDYGEVKACGLRVKQIEISKSFYRNDTVSIPTFSFDASGEAAFLRCDISSLKEPKCSESITVGPYAEYATKCTGDLQISCRACVDHSVDSCSCGTESKVAFFRKNTTTSSSSGSLHLSESSDLNLASTNKSAYPPFSFAIKSGRVEVTDLDKILNQAQNIINPPSGSPQPDLSDFNRINNALDLVTGRLGATIQEVSRSFIQTAKQRKCTDKLVVGFINQALNLSAQEPAVFGSSVRAHLDRTVEIIRQSETVQPSSGLYLANNDSCSRTVTTDNQNEGKIEYGSGNANDLLNDIDVNGIFENDANSGQEIVSQPDDTDHESETEEVEQGEEADDDEIPPGKILGGAIMALGGAGVVYGLYTLTKSSTDSGDLKASEAGKASGNYDTAKNNISTITNDTTSTSTQKPSTPNIDIDSKTLSSPTPSKTTNTSVIGGAIDKIGLKGKLGAFTALVGGVAALGGGFLIFKKAGNDSSDEDKDSDPESNSDLLALAGEATSCSGIVNDHLVTIGMFEDYFKKINAIALATFEAKLAWDQSAAKSP